MVPLDPVPRPLDHLLRGEPQSVALIDRAGATTYAEAEAAVAAMAAALAPIGGQAERVGEYAAHLIIDGAVDWVARRHPVPRSGCAAR